MTAYQPAIFDRSSRQHLFLEFILRPANAKQAVKNALVREALIKVIATDSASVKTVYAFGPTLCQQLDLPVSFVDFSLDGVVPATQTDLFVWLQADSRSDLFDLAMKFRDLLDPVFTLQLEQDGFVYHDMRDLTGFVDGIGNPEGDKALAAALLPEDQAGAGGSFVFAQLWRHDLASFNKLSVADQENVIGRTKVDAVEFDDERMPVDAHVGRTDVARDGVPQTIWRRSVPWGASSQHGLYFLAFSCEVERFDYLLRRMYGLIEDEVRDQLTYYSAPQTGSYWYAPTVAMLSAL